MVEKSDGIKIERLPFDHDKEDLIEAIYLADVDREKAEDVKYLLRITSFMLLEYFSRKPLLASLFVFLIC